MDPQTKNSPPVMDVTAPPAQSPQLNEAVAPAPPETEPGPDQGEKKAPVPPKPKLPKEPKSGVGFAIFATVVIVFGLAALATYAYLQSK
jgi:hypothetical protein